MGIEIAIQSRGERGQEALASRLAELRAEFDDLVLALRFAVAERAPVDQPVAALTDFLTGAVMPWVRGNAETVFPLAAGRAETALLARAVAAQGDELARLIRSLDGARTPAESLAFAERAAAIFTGRVSAITDLLLPALQDADGEALADAIRAAESRAAELAAEPPVSSTGSDATEILDVRMIAHHGSRHDVIFGKLGLLAAGERLVIVNDHDPKPLRYQMDAMWPNTYDWDYLLNGPEEWRIAITRRA